MGENIALLYMSAYFAQPAPEGSKNRFLRTQTNEAAVSALWKDPASRPDKIVALCSDTVRTKPTVPVLPERAAVPQPDQPRHGQRG